MNGAMNGAGTAPQERPAFRDVYTVSRLNREARRRLEAGFALTWVEGEISNLARPASGHIYFSLKDADAQVRCAMFRSRNAHLGFTPENGMNVLLRARVGLYEPRGEFQLVAEHMEEAGDGALRRAFEALKHRLDSEGLFDTARKRPLPTLPGCIGVVTSPSGAAIRDILTTLRRRFPALPVILYPVPVQGTGAGEQIARSIRLAGDRAECDVLIVGRGGGSLEDLWSFNEEVVARAIHDSPIPVVTGIGHEIDFTIADFVADCRCPTPTGAAERVSPDQQEWLARLEGLAQRLGTITRRHLAHRRQRMEWLGKRLRHPGRRLQDIGQRLDELEGRLGNGLHSRLRHARARLETLEARVHRHNPGTRVNQLRDRFAEQQRRIEAAWRHAASDRQRRLGSLGRALDAVSPLATLGRGYAIVSKLPEQTLLRTARDAEVGDLVEARLGEGRLVCRITETKEDT